MIKLTIDQSCIQCGQCVAVCPANILTQDGKQGEIGIVNLHTCIQCSHCVTICPTNSVQHSTFPASTVHEINKEILSSADSLLELMRKRRSNRAFSSKPVPMNLIDKVLEAAHLAPTGGNRQSLEYTVVTDPKVLEAVHQATFEVCNRMAELLKDAVDPEMKAREQFCKRLINTYKNGYEFVLRYAKAMIIIHSENPQASSDANIAYQNASLMAEALDIAHFYTGYVCNFATYDSEGTIAKTMGIKGTIYAGMALSMPKYTFSKYADRKTMIVNKLI